MNKVGIVAAVTLRLLLVVNNSNSSTRNSSTSKITSSISIEVRVVKG